MIARMWRGPVPKAKKEAYVAYLRETGLNDYVRTPGNRGVWLLCQDRGEEIEFLTFTLWDSLDAIKAFAGPDYERARYYPRDREFLTRFDPRVEHFEVVDM
jgi:heme-degrading monooxygenase HmoA